ncbi:MAG: bifunctional phosphoribosyl-AMP cyclohydrolase/phosphoribosyl-ATP diphosphatase HisIE [Bacillota bacterium]|nr:bifunctional phosphoribosyl-AMP cyclohydrolase/phosphoribosyl-ATP diphosphatase HisIE [Bacillota bacterium]
MNRFSKDLVPAVVQNALNGRILMLAYMNEEAYNATLATEEVHFYSRSRQSLWKKGATSGHTLKVKELLWDCDGDSILVKVLPNGPACHTGQESCFHNQAFETPMPMPMDITARIAARLAQYMQDPSPRSYGRDLMTGPLAQCAKKIVEEAGELAIAAVADSRERVVSESADLLFHTVALLVRRSIIVDEVLLELSQRWKGEQG